MLTPMTHRSAIKLEQKFKVSSPALSVTWNPSPRNLSLVSKGLKKNSVSNRGRNLVYKEPSEIPVSIFYFVEFFLLLASNSFLF